MEHFEINYPPLTRNSLQVCPDCGKLLLIECVCDDHEDETKNKNPEPPTRVAPETRSLGNHPKQ